MNNNELIQLFNTYVMALQYGIHSWQRSSEYAIEKSLVTSENKKLTLSSWYNGFFRHTLTPYKALKKSSIA